MPSLLPSLDAPKSVRLEPNGKSFTIRVLHSFADAEPMQTAWNDLVLRSGADVYQTFEWCRLWWRHYGMHRQLQLLLCFSGEEMVGLIPAFVETLWLGPARIRAAKLIGSDFSLQLCNLPIMPDAIEQAVSRAVRHFLGDEKCDVWIAGPLSGPTARIEEILDTGRNETELVESAESLGHSITTRFDLPHHFDEYLNEIGSRQRGNYNRSLKQFAKNHQVVTDTVTEPEEVLREFERFQWLHQAQWAAEGKLGHFVDWPKAAEFNRDLVMSFGKLGMVRFFRILADAQVASSQFCLLFGGTNYWRLPGRVCKPDWEKLSLGKMGLIQMIEASLDQGVTAVEGGRGHYDYKLQLGGREWPLRTLQFTRRGLGVSMRVKLFRAFASVLNVVYYKILFLRLLPRFPILQRSLWPVWIRSTW